MHYIGTTQPIEAFVLQQQTHMITFGQHTHVIRLRKKEQGLDLQSYKK